MSHPSDPSRIEQTRKPKSLAKAYEAAGGGSQEPTGDQTPKRASGEPLNTHGSESRLTVSAVTHTEAYKAKLDREEQQKGGGRGA